MLIWAGFVIFISFVLVLAWIDYKTLQLPDGINLSFLWLGLLINTLGVFAEAQDAILGASFGYLSFYFLEQIYFWIRQRHGLGRGDAKLLAALGAWLGWQNLAFLVLLAALFALVLASMWGIKQIMLNKEIILHKPFPFAPMLGIAGIILMVLTLWTKLNN